MYISTGASIAIIIFLSTSLICNVVSLIIQINQHNKGNENYDKKE